MPLKCSFKSKDETISCKRDIHKDGVCLFHLPLTERSPGEDTIFRKKIDELIEKEDTNWAGFIFPNNFFIYDLTINKKLDLRWSITNDITINNVSFNDEVDMRHTTASGNFHISKTIFRKKFKAAGSTFHKSTQINAEHSGSTYYNQCNFHGPVLFTGSINGTTSFHEATFHDTTIFRGGRSVHVTQNLAPAKDKKTDNSITLNWLFNSETLITEVDFRHPERVKFISTNLSQVKFVGTNVKGVNFEYTNFYQSYLKRQGLFDEVDTLLMKDPSLQKYLWPRIEVEYRNFRVAMEENKNYATASDFYIGEMETRRHQMTYPRKYFFSIAAIYNALSEYGTNPSRAARIFLLLILLHLSLTMYFGPPPREAYNKAFSATSTTPLITNTFGTLLLYFTNSLKILSLQRGPEVLETKSLNSNIIDSVFRIIGPAQLALIALSFRSKIKRH